MKTSFVISVLILVVINSFISECNGQVNELQKHNNSSIDDTSFFEVDPKYKDAWIHFEEMPEFPGGEKALIDYISENTIYPQSAIKDSIAGLVTLIFIIDTDGSTKNFKIIKKVRDDLDNECIRVIEEMPNWKPGSTVFRAKKGLYRKIVPDYYSITFNFMLNDVGNKKGIIIKPK